MCLSKIFRTENAQRSLYTFFKSSLPVFSAQSVKDIEHGPCGHQNQGADHSVQGVSGVIVTQCTPCDVPNTVCRVHFAWSMRWLECALHSGQCAAAWWCSVQYSKWTMCSAKMLDASSPVWSRYSFLVRGRWQACMHSCDGHAHGLFLATISKSYLPALMEIMAPAMGVLFPTPSPVFGGTHLQTPPHKIGNPLKIHHHNIIPVQPVSGFPCLSLVLWCFVLSLLLLKRFCCRTSTLVNQKILIDTDKLMVCTTAPCTHRSQRCRRGHEKISHTNQPWDKLSHNP